MAVYFCKLASLWFIIEYDATWSSGIIKNLEQYVSTYTKIEI